MSGWVDDYAAESIKANIVPCEGDYHLRIEKVETGTIEAKDGEPAKRYFRIDCLIAAEGYPHVSIFLTEGKNFNANATAFFDTFGIQRGNWNYEEWKMLEGWMHIELKKNGQYTNMVPRYILNSDGYVDRSIHAPKVQPQAPAQNQAPQYNGPIF